MEEGFMRRSEDERRQLLNLIQNKREWMMRDAEEKKLELRLGPPREEDWQSVEEKHEESSVLSIGYPPKASKTSKRVFLDTVESKPEGFLQLKTTMGCGKDSSSQNKSERSEQKQSLERKACCPSSSHAAGASCSGSATGAIDNSSQTRAAAVRVVGWPPVRSFRKNLASSSSKPPPAPQNGSLQTEVKPENSNKGLFVKINMDGIPIGRKVDLKAYDSYEKLCSAVDELFRGLLTAQRDPAIAGSQSIAEEKQVFTGLLDGSGEYTLVYEDHEGDRMLVGDVPWEMFVSTAKRLRVLKSSELSALSLGAISRKRTATGC